MSPMALLLLLLVLAYIGSMRVSAERKRVFGSPSGIEYVVLGLLLGPEALGVLGQDAMAAFEPIAIMALGWIGLVFGVECGFTAGRRAPFGRLALGVLFTVATALSTAAAVYALAGFFGLPGGEPRRLLSGAMGLVSAETARHAVRWIGERQPLSGPLADLLLDLAAADDAPVLVALAVLLAELSGAHRLRGIEIPPLSMAGLTLAIGCLLGVLSSFLFRGAASTVERWTILLGAAWLATGVTKSLGLAALTATFALGVTLSALSREGPRLRAQVGDTEGAVLLPTLVLAGARLEPPQGAAEVALIATALGMRVATSFGLGFCVALARPETRGLGGSLGAGMLASGTLTMIVGFGISMRCPEEIARPALAVAFLGTLLGEVVGPAALRRTFGREEAAQSEAEGAGGARG